MTRFRNPDLRACAFPAQAALCFLACCSTLLFAQKPEPSAVRQCVANALPDRDGCILSLAHGQTITLPIVVAADRMRMLTADQMEGSIEIQIAPPGASAGDPYANQAGLHSRISVLVAPAEQIIIRNPSKDKAAKAVLTLGDEREANANAKLEREAEKAFAHAELLRTQDSHDHASALGSYDDAIAKWQSADNQASMARALIWKADFIVNNQGKAPLAPPVIERATPILPQLETIEAAHYWQVIAFIHAVMGEYGVVRDAYARSLSLYEAAGDSARQAKVLDNAARVELMEGHTDIALSNERRAVDLATTAGDARRQAFVQEELGAIYSTTGDSESAYRAYGEALRALKRLPPEPRMEAAIWVDLSDLYMTLGDLARVKDSLDQTTAIWKTTDYPIGMVDTLNNYGDLYLVKGSPQEARKYFERGLALASSINYQRGGIALLSGLGESYLYEGDVAHAEEVLGRALAKAKKSEQIDSEMQIHCQLGDLALLKHDAKEAASQYGTCSSEAIAAHDAYTQIRAEGGLARTALENGALDNGQTHCEKALGMIEATRGQLRNQDLKTSFFASQHSYYDLDIQILERMDTKHPSEGYAWQAFLIAERARARTLLDQVTATDARPETSPALLALYADVQRKLRKLESSKSTAKITAVSSAKRNAVERLTISEHQLHDEIVAAGQSGEGLPAPQPLTLKSLQDALPERNAVLLEYWTGDTASFAWTITRTGIHSFRLPPGASLIRLCLGYRKAVLSSASSDPSLSVERRAASRSSQEAERSRLGLQLSKTLLPRSMIALGTKTVFVVGDGPLELLPFASLPGLPQRDIDFLSEPSATIFSILETHPTTPHTMRVAIFAEEAASSSGVSHESRLSLPTDRTPPLTALPFASDEAMMIRSTLGVAATRLFPASQVSRDSLKALDWSEYSMGHFAMHAVLNEQYAELSGLALNHEGSQNDAGNFLWYGDVCHLHARLDLVVLSACNTALGKQVPGEGLRGLTQAFFAAGSQRVLGTLWQVDDQATSEWMRHFYQALKITRSPVKALHVAQKAMAADPQWSAPYYWAGFVLSGDWRPLPQ